MNKELRRLEDIGVIKKITEPTDWVIQFRIVKKKNNTSRICIYLRELNKALKREHYTLPIVDDILFEFKKSKIFSKVDLNIGYWQIQLNEASSLLTTFQANEDRYRWTRLTFRLKRSSEIFQRKINEN